MPLTPVSPRPLLNTLLGPFLAFSSQQDCGHLFERQQCNPRCDEVQEAAGLSTLGQIAQMRGDRTRTRSTGRRPAPTPGRQSPRNTERCEPTSSSRRSTPRSRPCSSRVRPGRGKTVTASNLAVVFAQAGRRSSWWTQIAEARRPQSFDLPNASGLTTLLRDDHVAASTRRPGHRTGQPTRDHDRAAPPNPAELLGSGRMQAVLERLKAEGDLLIFDSPPLQAVADGAVLSSFWKNAPRDRCPTEQTTHSSRARETLTRAGATDPSGSSSTGYPIRPEVRTTTRTTVTRARRWRIPTSESEEPRSLGVDRPHQCTPMR